MSIGQIFNSYVIMRDYVTGFIIVIVIFYLTSWD